MARHTTSRQDVQIRHAESNRDEDNIDELVAIIEDLDEQLDQKTDRLDELERGVEELQEELKDANQRAESAEYEALHPRD